MKQLCSLLLFLTAKVLAQYKRNVPTVMCKKSFQIWGFWVVNVKQAFLKTRSTSPPMIINLNIREVFYQGQLQWKLFPSPLSLISDKIALCASFNIWKSAYWGPAVASLPTHYSHLCLQLLLMNAPSSSHIEFSATAFLLFTKQQSLLIHFRARAKRTEEDCLHLGSNLHLISTGKGTDR